MSFTSALSRHPHTATAVGEVVGEVLDRLGEGPDLALVFATPGHLAAFDQAASTIQTLLGPRVFIGTSASGVLADSDAVETKPGLVLWAGRWGRQPDDAARIRPLALEALPRRHSDAPWEFRGMTDVDSTEGISMILLADPFTFPVEEFLATLRSDHPTLPVIGGLSSAAHTPTGNRHTIGGRVLRSGAVAALVPNSLMLDPLVSQGCRPIGAPLTVTKSMDNVLYELAGRPALDVVLELVAGLRPDDRALADLGLHCGIVVNESKLEFERGDFLIRGVMGASREHRAVVIGDNAPIGTTIQFQVRDAATAGEDLEFLLLAQPEASDGALLFTCNGRGEAMFGASNHDAEIVARDVSGGLAGMFCAGEIGPIGERNAVHGFTASLARFRE